jgi:glycine dehydrogenase subunit 1
MPTPYIPNTDTARITMFEETGIKQIDDLFKDVPPKFLNASFELPLPLSEMELKTELKKLTELNANLDDFSCFLGAGYYRHFIPSIVSHITGRSEFYTAYTPYQAEVSQGTLSAIYDYQSLVCQLTGMDVSNAGMYDGSTAAAEGALMACRITGRNKIAVLPTINPRIEKVIATYSGGRHITVERVTTDPSSDALHDCACLIVQQPNFYGYFEDLEKLGRDSHNAGALLVVIVNPVFLAMFKPPSDFGADIVVAEGQPLGIPLSFGGPSLGIFACRKEYMRQMPGRLVGKTVDVDGNTGFVLTMATREQHIRRERATSNICTNSALAALAATVYMLTLGKWGLNHIAKLSYDKAHYMAGLISKISGYTVLPHGPFFNEFVVKCPASPTKINDFLYKNKIVGGLDISDSMANCMLICATEMNTRQEIDKLVELLKVGKSI